MDDIDTIGGNVEQYRTLRDNADVVEQSPAPSNVAEYDMVVEIGDDVYGVNVDEEQASAEKALRESGADVYGARELRGSASANILSEDMRELTVEEAVETGLEPSGTQPEEEEVPVEQSPTAGRYGFDRAVRSD